MLETRGATQADAALIAAHRKAMFLAIGRSKEQTLDEMNVRFEPWVARMIDSGKYMGWITEDGEQAVASAGMLVLDWPPHPLDPAGERRGYLLNVFVEPEYRRRGLASALVERCMTTAREMGMRIVALHASKEGRPVYEAVGFRTSNEMLYMGPKEG